MKKIKFSIIALLSVIMLSFNCNFAAAQTTNQKANVKISEVTFSVPTMECANCQKKVVAKMPYVKGVKDLKTDLKERTVWIKYDASKTDIAQLSAALEKVGFPGKQVK